MKSRKYNQIGAASTALIGIILSMVLGLFYVYYTQLPKCDEHTTLGTLKELLIKDRLAQPESINKNYNTDIEIVSVKKKFSKGDSIACDAVVNIKISPENTALVDHLKKTYDENSIMEKFPQLLHIITTKQWSSSARSFTLEVAYETSENKVLIGGDNGMWSYANYTGLQASIKALEKFIEYCLDKWMNAYREETQDNQAIVTKNMQSEWTEWCKSGKLPE